MYLLFFVKQNTAYEMRISDWSSYVCSSDLDTYLGDAVGRAYAEKYFPASAKAEVGDMVDGIKAAFAKRVDTIDWMAPETKKEAIKKVETIVVGVGYPESWRDYGRYTVAADSAYANEIAGRSEEHTSELQSLMRNSYAVFCLKKKNNNESIITTKKQNTTQ